MRPFDEIIYSTVRIEGSLPEDICTTGTGFICNFCVREGIVVPAIVTNRHVIEGTSVGCFYMTIANDQGEPKHGEHVPVVMENFATRWITHSNNEIDLAALPLAEILRAMESQGKKPFYRGVPREVWADAEFMNKRSAVEDVLMIGYPNGLWDTKNNLPIVRSGITATPPYIDFEGKPQFVIDCACFPGSSGSPVYVVYKEFQQKQNGVVYGRRVKLLGVLWGGPQFVAEGKVVAMPVPSAFHYAAHVSIPNNLGYCIKAEQLMDFERQFDVVLSAVP